MMKKRSMTKKEIKFRHSLIFDFDNTIAGNFVPEALKIIRILKKYRNFHDESKFWDTINDFTSDYHICSYFLVERDAESAYKEILDLKILNVKNLVYYPEVKQVIVDLSNRYNLFIASGRDKRSLDLSLEKENLLKYFTETVGIDRNFVPKPDPMMIKYITSKYEISTETCIYIGDKLQDYQTAQNAGCFFIGARWYKQNITKEVEYICDEVHLLEKMIRFLLVDNDK
jgi:phosphoglycolate phosphatase/pyrophosphatase PpaX